MVLLHTITGVFAVKYWNPPWNIILKAKLIYHSIYHSFHALLATLTQADPRMEIELTWREYQLLFPEIEPFLQFLGRQHFLFPVPFMFSIYHTLNKIECLEILQFINLTTHVLCFWIQQFLTESRLVLTWTKCIYIWIVGQEFWFSNKLIFHLLQFQWLQVCCNKKK